jgi:hypothetical protein
MFNRPVGRTTTTPESVVRAAKSLNIRFFLNCCRDLHRRHARENQGLNQQQTSAFEEP